MLSDVWQLRMSNLNMLMVAFTGVKCIIMVVARKLWKINEQAQQEWQ